VSKLKDVGINVEDVSISPRLDEVLKQVGVDIEDVIEVNKSLSQQKDKPSGYCDRCDYWSTYLVCYPQPSIPSEYLDVVECYICTQCWNEVNLYIFSWEDDY
jgi:hypothetical protein